MAQVRCFFYHPSDRSFLIEGTYDDTAPLPANATDIEPQAPRNGFVNVFDVDNTEWVETIDKRGTRTFNTADGIEGNVIMSIGEDVPQGYTDQQPADWPNYPTMYTFDVQNKNWVLDPQKEQTKQIDGARLRRTSLLGGSDWVTGNDVPIAAQNLQDFARYRQLLRDIPTQQGWPANITWPAAPAYAKDANGVLDNAQTKSVALAAGYADAKQNPIP